MIRTVNLKKLYTTEEVETTALDNVNIDIKEKEFVAIMGPSGCGKSTLLRLIHGLETPTAGDLEFRGAPIRGVCPQMSMVFQSFALFPWLTVQENVAFGLEALRWDPERIRAQVERYLSVTGLVGFEEAYPRELSGGMRQRVGLARALAVEPGVLLMDEPFSALDPLTAEALREEVLQLWRDPALPPESVLLVTHNIEEAILMADRVVVLSRRPSHVLETVPIPLARPRDRKSPEVYELMDRVYSLITEGSARPGSG